jgi:hypothetical protein
VPNRTSQVSQFQDEIAKKMSLEPISSNEKGRALLPYQAVAVGFVWIASGEKL